MKPIRLLLAVLVICLVSTSACKRDKAVGPAGPAGAAGANGADGAQGATGPAGAAGPQGPAGPAGGPVGPAGPAGPVGATGANGATGATGLTGATGPAGATGATGAQGAAGADGATGAQGAAGAAGPQGATGPAGPAGAAGAAGPAGATGATGPQGPQGPPGNANVQSYILIAQGVFSAGLTKLTVPAITQAIVDEGMVLVYFRNTGSSGAWFSIPYSEAGNTITMSDFGVGYVDLKANFTQADAFDFRVVVITGTGVTTLVANHPHLNLNNFSEVAGALHLSQ